PSGGGLTACAFSDSATQAIISRIVVNLTFRILITLISFQVLTFRRLACLFGATRRWLYLPKRKSRSKPTMILQFFLITGAGHQLPALSHSGTRAHSAIALRRAKGRQ